MGSSSRHRKDKAPASSWHGQDHITDYDTEYFTDYQNGTYSSDQMQYPGHYTQTNTQPELYIDPRELTLGYLNYSEYSSSDPSPDYDPVHSQFNDANDTFASSSSIAHAASS